MDRVETLAGAIWAAIDTAQEFPWETLAKKPRDRMMGVARDIIYTTAEEVFFLKNRPPEDAES